ncbi:hypothetical protein ACP70R_043342 [Stipagrostis hirtigluma subsp. patula]
MQAKGRAAPPPPNSVSSAGGPSSSGTPSNKVLAKGRAPPPPSEPAASAVAPSLVPPPPPLAGRQQAVVSPSPISYGSSATPELLGSLNDHVGTTQASIKEGGPSSSSNAALAAILEKASELDIPKEIVECNIKKTLEKGQDTFTEKIHESHSSVTDDESRSSHSFHSRNQKAIHAVYALDKERQIGDEDGNALYDVMRKEVRQAVEEIRTQLEKAVTKSEPSEKTTDAQPTQVITELRRSYTSKLEESEQRKQELLTQLAAEEQRGHELTKIVRELLPTSKKNANQERQPRHRRRSNDRSRMSKRLTEEAERYFEDFLSNVDDTDFSSFDGERSDTSLTRKDVLINAMTETPVMLPKVFSPVEADGVVLPWLQWETSNDLSPCKTKDQLEKVPHAALAIISRAAVGVGVLETMIVQRPLQINCSPGL